MKILKLLNKKSLSIFFFLLIIFSTSLQSEEEPVDIWKLEKEVEENNSDEILKNDEFNEDDNEINNSNLNSSIDIIDSNLLSEKENIVGLYDPEENGLNIDMWLNSDGNEIKLILNKISKMSLSKDSKEILDIALLTNSYFPNNNISEEEFVDFKLNYLIMNNNNDLIKLYLIKNESSIYNSKLIKFYINSFLENADLENACEIFDNLNYIEDNYINKLNIYCLINQNNREEAQLLFDLKKETGFKDDFFEDKFNFLMGYNEDSDKISDENILNFFLSHRTNPNFSYKPDKNTPKFIWKYLSSTNLLENIDSIDLEDSENISLIEQATHEKNYEEEELFELYKRFQFNINQLLNVKESYKLLQNYEGRALLYQRLILTKDVNELLDLSYKLKQSFKKDNLENAFNKKLKEILSFIDEDEVPSNYSSFYSKNISTQKLKKKKTKINNKIIHQSKILKYFEEENDINKTQEDLDKLLKSIKKNKDYIVSTKDLILLESLISDGIEVKKKYKNMFKFDQSIIPTDLQMLLNNNEVAMILLRLVEIIGEDDLESLDADTLYFMTSILNVLNLDLIRNKLLLKVLPLKI